MLGALRRLESSLLTWGWNTWYSMELAKMMVLGANALRMRRGARMKVVFLRHAIVMLRDLRLTRCWML